MKMSTIRRRLDNAASSMLDLQSALKEDVQSSDGAKVVASMMSAPIDELILCVESLPDGRKGKRPAKKCRLPTPQAD